MTRSEKLELTQALINDLEMVFGELDIMNPAYLDRNTGKVVIIFEDESLNEDQDLIQQVENDADQERFIPIPGQHSREGWEQMKDFIDDLEDEHQQDVLYTAIEGRGAFRRFKDALYRVNLVNEWYAFKGREDRRSLLDWLFSYDLIEETDIAKGVQMYERDLSRRERREENLEKMVKGAAVICSDNAGHIGQVTPGTTYEVLDENKEQLNIRIKDDRGKIIWIPKAHFELVSEA